MNKEYKQEIIDFINEHNLDDVFVIEDDFYNNFKCHLYVYIRVSTENQDFGRQILELYEWLKKKDIKICIDCIFCDKYTGKKLTRKEYEEMHNLLSENDYLLVSELNRLGRNWDNTKKEWQFLTDKNINTIILDNSMLSAKLPNEKQETITLEYKFVRDIVFNAINYVASKKIEEVSRSTKAGLKKAKMQGKRIGRPSQNTISTKENLISTIKLCVNEEKSYDKACKITRYPLGTFRLKIKQIRDTYKVKELTEILNILESGEN